MTQLIESDLTLTEEGVSVASSTMPTAEQTLGMSAESEMLERKRPSEASQSSHDSYISSKTKDTAEPSRPCHSPSLSLDISAEFQRGFERLAEFMKELEKKNLQLDDELHAKYKELKVYFEALKEKKRKMSERLKALFSVPI